MIPKIHDKGSSFKGIAQYVLHDIKAETSHRVGWTETINLGTKNPHTAHRVMAATAMDAARLKRQAGVRNTGRKSKDVVMHVSLSWHPDEAKDLSKGEMLRAARWFLREIKADDRQVLIVQHNDEKQPHVHMVINRVSPRDGRLLSSSFERMKASRWAEKYERERTIYCHQRIINNAARKRGEFTRGEADLPRHIYEQHKLVANDNSQQQALINEQRKRAGAIAKRERESKLKRRAEWTAAQQSWRNAVADHQAQSRKAITQARQRARQSFRLKWQKLHHERETALAAFDRLERTLRGRMENVLRLIQWRQLLGRRSAPHAPSITQAFRMLSSEGARKEMLLQQFEVAEKNLKREQIAAEKHAVNTEKKRQQSRLRDVRKELAAQRSQLIQRHQQESDESRVAWKEHRDWQQAAWTKLLPRLEQSVRQKRIEELRQKFAAAQQKNSRGRGLHW